VCASILVCKCMCLRVRECFCVSVWVCECVSVRLYVSVRACVRECMRAWDCVSMSVLVWDYVSACMRMYRTEQTHFSVPLWRTNNQDWLVEKIYLNLFVNFLSCSLISFPCRRGWVNLNIKGCVLCIRCIVMNLFYVNHLLCYVNWECNLRSYCSLQKDQTITERKICAHRNVRKFRMSIAPDFILS
jgi:hypothetical protein